MKSRLLTVSLALFASLLAHGRGYTPTPCGFSATAAGCRVELAFYGDAIVRVTKTPLDFANAYVDPYAVTAAPGVSSLDIKEYGDRLVAHSKKLSCTFDRATGKLVIARRKGGTVLLEEANPGTFKPMDDAGRASLSSHISFILSEDERLYGLGIRQNGKASQRGIKARLEQGNLEDAVPIVTSSKGYSLFVDNLSPLDFDSEGALMSFDAQIGECIDYYVLDGGTADGCVSLIRSLTGKAPMLPLWTYGFWQSRERYRSWTELKDVVRTYRRLGIPLDGIIQDWQYWGGNYTWNAMDFLAEGYRDGPVKNLEEVHDMNAHTIISIWSSFGPQTIQYRQLDSMGAILHDFATWPESGFDIWPPLLEYPSGVRCYDPFNPKARELYWDFARRGLYDRGVDGFWMDSTEPDLSGLTPGKVQTQQTSVGTMRKVRNAFPLVTVEGMASNMRAYDSSKRVFILTRSAFAGQQRTGANTWSGDTESTWEALRCQISAGLNFTLTGNPQYNSDIGGFFPSSLGGPDSPAFRELYVRWMQYGAFTPMMRSHGTGFPREVYLYGKEGEPVYDALVRAIKWRYALLPYTYSVSWDVSHNDGSFLRAFVFDFPSDSRALDIADEYMYGPAILVAPIVAPGASYGLAGREVYLPEGVLWYDWLTGEKHHGGQTVYKSVAIDQMPLYVRAGSIVPLGPDVQYAAGEPWDKLTLKLYPGADGEFILYEDEGDGYGYESGAYTEIPLLWDDSSRTLTIDRRRGSFSGMLLSRSFTVVTPDGHSVTVPYTGSRVRVRLPR